MLGPALYDRYPTGAIPKPGKNAIVSKKAVYPFPYHAKTNTISLPAQIERELRGLVSTGNNVEAMKRVISLTGAGLRVSKDYVDKLAKRH
jgi:ribosomal protein L7/L12